MHLFRSHRRVIIAALAAVALVAQALLPHVHAWQSGEHGAAVFAATDGARIAAPAHEADHEPAACPTCRALAQSRQLAPAPRAAALAFVALRVADPTLRIVAFASRVHAAPAAPRAPPVSA